MLCPAITKKDYFSTILTLYKSVMNAQKFVVDARYDHV